MNGPRHRAWRFLLPLPGALKGAGGLQCTPAGGIAMVEGEAAVRQSLLLLLATQPGERVMRPSYGCDLERLVFSDNDETTAGLAIHYVRQAVERWEPRVEIVNLDAGSAADAGRAGTLEIVLEYRVHRTGRTGQLTHRLDLTGGG